MEKTVTLQKEMSIPKKIHYCWFGGKPKPAAFARLLEGWRRLLSDYEIKEWNETNFDTSLFPYVREAYLSGNYAFVSDVCRVKALHDEGGIYMDTDVELLKSFDSYLADGAFLGLEGEQFGTAVMGSEAGARWLKIWLDYYRHTHFINIWGHTVRHPNTKILTRLIWPQLSEDERPRVYPWNRFCAKDMSTGEVRADAETVAIHHFEASWRHRKTTAERIRNIIKGLKIRYLK